MKVITYGDIMDGGNSVFNSVAELDGDKLNVSFRGSIRIDNPYMQLSDYIHDLENDLVKESFEEAKIDFSEMIFCNSNGFYIIMDIIEIIYSSFKGNVLVKRLKNDDWQQETLPILLDYDDPEIKERITFEEISEF